LAQVSSPHLPADTHEVTLVGEDNEAHLCDMLGGSGCNC